LLQGKKPDDPLRCWVVGCSTGEEAYSLAMMISEAMEKLKKHLNVQIFATDIDETAIENARKGLFPESIATDVSKARLDHFFTKDDGVFRINKQIRDMVVFSLHSIIKDPPFSRLDLVSCRNLMIYLDRSLQKKIIPLFHYTLNSQGVLFLGTSETIGEFTDLFQPLNAKWKIFKRKESLREGTIDYPNKSTLGGKANLEPDDRIGMPVTTDIRPVTAEGLPPGLLLAIFEEKAPSCLPDEPPGKASVAKKIDPSVHQLEQELQSTHEYLQATIEELETSNEELKSNNEEMQSVNEEMQSTNEELETSKAADQGRQSFGFLADCYRTEGRQRPAD
jgi:FtsZ-binding cell division protein ZapB